MCYSILVETDLSKLADQFDAEIDVESFLHAYQGRESGQELISIPRAIDRQFRDEASPSGKKIWDLACMFIDVIKRR